MESIGSAEYGNMDLAQRCDSLAEARATAYEDEQEGTRQAAYARDDPRFAPYLAERNRIRAAAGKSLLR